MFKRRLDRPAETKKVFDISSCSAVWLSEKLCHPQVQGFSKLNFERRPCIGS
jgi:hypothetical protein